MDRYNLISQMILRLCSFDTIFSVGQIIAKTACIDKYWRSNMETFELNIVMIMVGLFWHFFKVNADYMQYLNMKIQKIMNLN